MNVHAFHLARCLILALSALIGVHCHAPRSTARLVDHGVLAAAPVGEPVTLTCTPFKPDPRARTDCRATGIDARHLPLGVLWVVRDSKGEIVEKVATGAARFPLFPGPDPAAIELYLPWHLVGHRYLPDGRKVWRLHHRFPIGGSR